MTFQPKQIVCLSVAIASLLMAGFGCGAGTTKTRAPGSVSSAVTATVEPTVAAEPANSPIVEGVIEFVGPDAKWAGPASMLLKLSAKPGQAGEAGALVSLTPTLVPTGVNATLDKVKERLIELERVSSGPQQEIAGCASPVKLRLVRLNGQVIDRVTCRGATPLALAASQTMAYFLDQTPATQPARTLAVEPPAPVVEKPAPVAVSASSAGVVAPSVSEPARVPAAVAVPGVVAPVTLPPAAAAAAVTEKPAAHGEVKK